MKSIILTCCVFLFLVSCKKKTVVENITSEEKKVSEKKEALPNIYVVKNTFPSKDSLPITADFYQVDNKPFSILLCHQAGFSRGEYKDTAIQLNHLGYSVVAIDQRSGNEANQILNETAAAAKIKGLPTTYIDARPDIEAAIDYLFAHNGAQPIILVGSSYAAALSLLIGRENLKVKAVAAFSPGEYIKGIQIAKTLKGMKKPIFVTSSKRETEAVSALLSQVASKYVMQFKSPVKGIHGSRALWESTNGYQAYWKAFTDFLTANN